jgi:hypothetical protein
MTQKVLGPKWNCKGRANSAAADDDSNMLLRSVRPGSESPHDEEEVSDGGENCDETKEIGDESRSHVMRMRGK